MNVRILLLALLNMREASGYEIKKLTDEGQFRHFVDISFGSIYPTLSRLESEGLVACREEPQSGKPDRKVYSITEAGKRELVRGLSQPPQPDRFKSEFLLLAANAHMAGPQAMARACSERIERIKEDLAMMEAASAECGHPTTEWVVGYGLHIMHADLAYLEAHKDKLIEIAEEGQMAEPLAIEAAE